MKPLNRKFTLQKCNSQCKRLDTIIGRSARLNVQTALSSLAYGEVNLPEKESTTQLKLNFDCEEWRAVAGYEQLYEVSNLGRLRRAGRGKGTYPGRIIGTSLSDTGYPQCGLFDGPKHWKHTKVHILVARAFLGPCPPGKEINHKNGNKTDARAENLEYITHQENTQHGYRLGLNPGPRNPAKGEDNKHHKLTEEQVRQIRALKGILSQDAIAKRFGITQPNVGYIHRGDTWKHVKP
jgi:HNH endonuclease/NUMOD4 motif